VVENSQSDSRRDAAAKVCGETPQPLCGHSMNFYRIIRKSSVKGKSGRMGASRASIFPALWLCGRAGQACG